MASQGFCSIQSISDPYTRSGLATASLQVTLAASAILTWSSGSPDTFTVPPVVRAVSVYDHTVVAVDATVAVWLLVAGQGTPNLWLVRESDVGSLGSLVPGSAWALLARIDGGSFQKIPQI